jgi:Uma2 family endonuclease
MLGKVVARPSMIVQLINVAGMCDRWLPVQPGALPTHRLNPTARIAYILIRMSAPSKVLMSVAEYLAFERASETKHEFVNGEVYAMSGASLEHVEISHNLHLAIGIRLRGKPCRPLGSDMRIRVPNTRMHTYPDLTIVCGEPILEDQFLDTLLNPTIIFEILSPSTERYDRGAKFAHYRRIETLKGYVLISQSSASVERHIRQEDGQWLLKAYEDLENDSLELPMVGLSVPLSEIYEGVNIATGPDPHD